MTDEAGHGVRRGADGLEPHPLAEALTPEGAEAPTGASTLWGYVGSSAQESVIRLWLDSSFTQYADVPAEAILANRTSEAEGRTCLWVDRKAKIKYGVVASQELEAQFLSGAISAASLATAASQSLMGRIAALRQQSLAGCVTKPLSPGGCPPTVACGPTIDCWVYASWPACGASRLDLCGPSSNLSCPTGGDPCPTVGGCPVPSFDICPPPTFECNV
jgi:hypothetical protein